MKNRIVDLIVILIGGLYGYLYNHIIWDYTLMGLLCGFSLIFTIRLLSYILEECE